jgi:hypothetical protein
VPSYRKVRTATRTTTPFFPFYQNMNSQGTPSTEVLSLISDVTEPSEVSGDVNAYFQKITLPETGKRYTNVLR